MCCREDLEEEQNGVDRGKCMYILRTKSQDSPVSEVEIIEMVEALFDDPLSLSRFRL